MKRAITALFVLGLLTEAAAPAIAGPVAAVDFEIVSAGDKWTTPSTRGWEFTANSAIKVLELGWYDTADDGTSDGFARPHDIGLWSVDGTLLASATLDAGASGTLEDHFRYVAISPVQLVAGGSYIIAGTMGSTDPALRDGTEFLVNLGSAGFTVQPEITISHGRDVFGTPEPLTFPDAQRPVGEAVFGPNFKFQPASVPEPASFVLAGTGIVGLCGSRIRRRATNGKR